MSDSRLNSMHLGFSPRRQVYRQAREALLDAEGWMTQAGEILRNAVGDPQEWPSLLPIRDVPLVTEVRFVLMDLQANCTYPLRIGLNAIGRYPNNDIVFTDNAISRRHCVILVHARGGCEVHDTASMNGTFVNGYRVQKPVPLRSGDRIQVCRKLLVIVSDAEYRAPDRHDGASNTQLDIA